MSCDRPSNIRRLLRLQFSLQTLLALTLVAAIGFAWFLAPTFEDETWGGGALKVRAELSVIREAPGVSPGEVGQVQHDGRWILYDRYERKLVNGYYRADKPVGHWTHFDQEGHRALEGQLRRELPVGEWTARHPNGRLSRRITFEQQERRLRIAHLAPSVNPGGPGKVEVVPEVSWIVARNGVAEVHGDNGTIRARGQFVADSRQGTWTFFDRDGEKIAQGTYRNGHKHGVWHRWTSPQAEPTTEYYARGRNIDDHQGVLRRLERDLLGDDRRLQILAARDLEWFGESALPALRRALVTPDSGRRLLAIRSLQLFGPEAATAAPDLARVCEDENPRVRYAAMVALSEVEPSQAMKLYRRLLDDLRANLSAGDTELLAALRRVGPAGIEHLAAALDRRGSVDVHIAVVDLLRVLYDDRRLQELSYGDPNLAADSITDVLEKARLHEDEAVRERAELQWDAPASAMPVGAPGGMF